MFENYRRDRCESLPSGMKIFDLKSLDFSLGLPCSPLS